MKKKLVFLFLTIFFTVLSFAKTLFEKDIIKTSSGDVEITFIEH